MLAFSHKTPVTRRNYGMDVWKQLKTAGTTLSTVSVSVSVITGPGSPTDLTVGAAYVYVGSYGSTIIVANIVGGLPGVTYIISFIGVCADGQVIDVQAQLAVVTVLP